MMELSEALRTIDATVGFLMQLQILEDADLEEPEDDKEGLGLLGTRIYTTTNSPNHRCRFKYRNGREMEVIVPQIAPICDLLINNWPSPSAKKLRSHIDESNVLYLANEILGLDDPIMYETIPEAYEYQALFKDNPPQLLYAIYDINYRLAYALRMTEERDNNEERDEDVVFFPDNQIKTAVEIMKKEKVIKHLYDYAYIMKIMNETQNLPTFNSSNSFITYFKSLKINDLPSEDSIKKKVNATFGHHPSWTFTDEKGKDANESRRRNAIGNRFLSILRKGK